MMIIDAVENAKAIRDVAYGFIPTVYDERLLPVDRKPPAKTIMERLAPNTAALDTPNVEGYAIVSEIVMFEAPAKRLKIMPKITAIAITAIAAILFCYSIVRFSSTYKNVIK